MNIIKKYIKELNDINSNDVMNSQLSQFKLHLKILGILYYLADINFHIISDIIEKVIKNIHIFHDIVLVFCPYIIKISPKLDIAII